MRRSAIIALAALALLSAGCSSMSQQDKGVVIGATSGAVIGGVIGEASGNTALGAILGAAIGGAAGGIIGNYMDKQAAEMERDLEGARIERVGEGIKITFDSGILFDVNQADLQPAAQENLGKLAVILKKYEDTNILIEGHTDADGSDAYNQQLSESRASSVAAYLGQHEVAAARMITVGYGKAQPVADNTTAAGKRQNRRVEVAVMANDKLKKAAEKQAGQG
ncbi:MAG: OmpA family protein [Candidatus Krumholzibacteriota bacterium]|nr:OmpA family protein [Candidatus Krumholzibacteriota bacterium]